MLKNEKLEFGKEGKSVSLEFTINDGLEKANMARSGFDYDPIFTVKFFKGKTENGQKVFVETSGAIDGYYTDDFEIVSEETYTKDYLDCKNHPDVYDMRGEDNGDPTKGPWPIINEVALEELIEELKKHC